MSYLTPDPSERKKVMFYDTADRQTRLRIRCQHDGITQSQFFRMMLTGYIEGDSAIVEFLEKQKEKHNMQGTTKRTKLSNLRKNTNKNIEKFALNEEEKESIFDMIEREVDL